MAIDVLLESPPDSPRERAARSGRAQASDVAVLLSLAWWATGVTWGTGGRSPHVLTIGLVLVGVSALLVRPWASREGARWTAAALGVGSAAYLVTLLSPTGWAGADEAASWVYSAMLVVLVRAWLTAGWRREALLCTLVVAPLLSFARGWLAWWGGEDASRPFLGTFYWHNQEGIFLALGVLAGLGLLLTGRRAVQLAGWFAVAVCGAGVVLSTSRASMMALAVGLLVLALIALAGRSWSVALRILLVAPVVASTSYLLTGPPFFPSRIAPLAGTEARAATGQSIGTNGGHRLDDWQAALSVFRHWPWTGAGFHGFGAASKQVAGGGSGSLTPFAHNGFLQLFVDGGLLLALPVLVVLGTLAVTTVHAVRAAVQRKDWAVISTGAGLLVLALHSAVDFDWSYPALLSAFGLAAVAAIGPCKAPQSPARNELVLGALVLALIALAAVATWGGGLDLNVPLGSSA